MEYLKDEKWKLSKDQYGSRSVSSNSSLLRSISQKSSTTKSPLLRSFSQKSSAHKSSKSSPSSSSNNGGSSSQKCPNFTRKCSSLAKEQRAKFYIVKRCITMLVCWHKHGDS